MVAHGLELRGFAYSLDKWHFGAATYARFGSGCSGCIVSATDSQAGGDTGLCAVWVSLPCSSPFAVHILFGTTVSSVASLTWSRDMRTMAEADETDRTADHVTFSAMLIHSDDVLKE